MAGVSVRDGILVERDDKEVVLAFRTGGVIALTATLTSDSVKLRATSGYLNESLVEIVGKRVIMEGQGVSVSVRLVTGFTRRYRVVIDHGLDGIVKLIIYVSRYDDSKFYTIYQDGLLRLVRLAEVRFSRKKRER